MGERRPVCTFQEPPLTPEPQDWVFSQELQLPLAPEHGWGGKLRSQSQGELPYHLAGVCTDLILSQRRLSSFVLNSVFRTSPKLQSSCNLEGQIDLLLHHSCI